MKLKFVLLIGVLLMFSFACKKENTRFSYQDGINGAKSFVTAQQMMVQLLNTYFKSLTDSAFLAGNSVKIDGADVLYFEDPERILIRYPWWGNDDGYGHWRMNTYEAFPRTEFSDPDVVVDIIFNDFLFDKDTLPVHNLVVKNRGKIDGVNDHFEVSASLVERRYSDSTGMLSFSFNQLYIRHKDPNTVYTSPDDYFFITGELNGTSKDLLVFHSTIEADSALLDSFSCNWLKSGVAGVTTERFKYPAFVYFPDQDTCLNQCLIGINDNPFPYPID